MKNTFFPGTENDFTVRESELFDSVEPCCVPESDDVIIQINSTEVLTVPCGTTENIPVLQDGVEIGSWDVDHWEIPPCPPVESLCELLAAAPTAEGIACMSINGLIPNYLCGTINDPEAEAQTIVDCIEDAGKTPAVQALICLPCEDVEIIDQDDVVIDTVICGDQYQVIVVSGINGGLSNTVYTNSIIQP